MSGRELISRHQPATHWTCTIVSASRPGGHAELTYRAAEETSYNTPGDGSLSAERKSRRAVRSGWQLTSTDTGEQAGGAANLRRGQCVQQTTLTSIMN